MKIMLSTIVLVFLTNCAPKIYVLDQPTLMQQESAGAWPNFRDDLRTKLSVNGPVPIRLKNKKNQSKNILNSGRVVK